MLYPLRHRSDALSGAAGEREAQWESEESSLNERRCNIVGLCDTEVQRVVVVGKVHWVVEVLYSTTII